MWKVWVKRRKIKVRGMMIRVTKVHSFLCCSLSFFAEFRRGSRKMFSLELRLFFPLARVPPLAKLGKRDPFLLDLPAASRSGVAERESKVSRSSVPELGSLSPSPSLRKELVLCISIACPSPVVLMLLEERR